ncbi:MAG: endonuclease domain-containing protein [Alphaproteobacteria bacterium]|nr:endonuclease domain-containing protein [Alphaproteobacteria bacterium]
MCKVFYYKKYDFNEQNGILSLAYATDKYTFTETITFPNAPFKLNDIQKKALNDILFLTHIAFGISYYKAFLCPKIQIKSGHLTKTQAQFFNTFYLNGLGEFSVKNNVSLNINFPFDKNTHITTHNLLLSDNTFVPVGGGKDSCVSIELLKEAGINATAFSVGNPQPITSCVQKSGLNHLILTRKIAPELLQLNETGKVYNGHVPITGLIAFLLWISGILYDHRYVAMSCERSANSPNMILNSHKINHQYSKSLDFEQDFYKLTQSITPAFRYFSLLRPLSEMHIAKLFSQKCESYFDVFTSCNKAFRLDEAKRLSHWCGNCDKCRFVFLILAPFMDKDILIKAIGDNPLDDENQLTGYEELLGISGHKPFECVGEVNECRYAFTLLAQKDEWMNDKIISKLSQKIFQSQDDILNTSSNHLIPERFKNVMDQFK